ncbi:probable serine/threonine-protein kinase pats1 [Orbicella faveolata]|uniref:probable serine/threonine-protein kinase pats1 n=1 Tax=Orbicella faveolata TaxID=48498 RepID=UPI0009E259E4|nr:probable serine/threonine-protein kinase pats1 [Orbicella faveolata]
MPNITGGLSNNFMLLALMATGKIDTAMLKGALNEKFPSLKLQILDFAGDKEYYAYHHMFLKSQAIYIIVFNIAKHVHNNFRNINGAIQRVQFWLESVCSHVPSKTPIFLVGTHRGDLNKNCMHILNGHLRKHLWDRYCDELVINDVDKLIFFPVENSKGENDVGVQSLRMKVMSVAEEREEVRDCDIPLSWIAIKDLIINQREKEKAKFCVTLKEFPYSFDNFICTDWSEETLKYFHEKGLLIYLDKDPELSKWVLLKPEILVNIIIQLVTPPPQMKEERGFRRDWKLLHRKGLLTKSLLTRIISTVQENEEALTAFLEEYDLICPLSNKEVNIYGRSRQDQKILAPENPGAHAFKFTYGERVTAVANAGSPSHSQSQSSRFLHANQKDRWPLTTRLDRKKID